MIIMDKKKLYDIVDKHQQTITTLSDKVWELAELSLLEYQTADYYCELMEKLGFTVERQVANVATAFYGSYGSGHPVIGILGEFDALDGLDQAAGTAQRQRHSATNTCGHGCGHNMLGAASLGAAIAIKEAIEAGELKGTVIFYGCPGEEGCAGKAFMAREGVFAHLDAALTWHPGTTNKITTGSNAASLQYIYSFKGLSAHAAGDPWDGRSALDAAELMNVGANFLREHIAPKECLHYSFLDVGGVSPNVVQPTASVLYMIRGENVRKAKALKKRVDDIAQGAALMTGTTVTQRQIDGTSSTLSNTVLEKLLFDNLKEIPLPQYTPEEWALAKEIFATYPHESLPGDETVLANPAARAEVAEKSERGTRVINDFIVPYVPGNTFSPGSTDVGDVSWLTPTAQFTAVTFASGSPGHSWQNVSLGRSSIGHKGVIYAAKVLAASVCDLMTDPDLLNKAKAEFADTAAEGYDCPLEKDLIAGPQAL